ncbi:MAG: YihY family inner membrane protein [Candidatus Omnitrophica bacterium]|nr:YihY family inner membrane protein [Candidatus Omnitrophota bacterium]
MAGIGSHLPNRDSMKKVVDYRFTIAKALGRFYKRQSEDHIFFLAGSLAYYSLIALVPVSAISLSLYVSFFEKEQKVVYDWAVRYLFPFSQGTKFDMFKLNKPDLDGSGTLSPESLIPFQNIGNASDELEISSVPSDGTMERAIPHTPTEAELKLAEFEETIERNITVFVEQAQKLGPIGLIALIITGIFLFDSIEDAFNTIWRYKKRRPFVKRFVTFWTFLAFLPIVMVGPMLLDQFIERRVLVADLSWARFLYGWLWLVLPFCITWVAIWLMYIHIPSESVDMRAAAISALVVALCWEIAKRLFAHYVTISSNYQIVYGSLALILYVLFWTYYTWWLLLLGLELTACIQFPPEDQLASPWELAPEVRLLYSWGGMHETGRHFSQGRGPISLNQISEALGLNHARVKPLLEEMQKKGLIAQDINGNWLPAVPLDRITWRDIVRAYDLQDENISVRLSEWLESALQARGVTGYHQDVENLPTLEKILERTEQSLPSKPPIPSIEDHSPERTQIVEAESSEDASGGSGETGEEGDKEC